MHRLGARCLSRRSPIRIPRNALSHARKISHTAFRMAGPLPAVEPELPTTKPTGAFQLLSTAEKAGDAEDAVFDEQVSQVNDWWSSPRYKGIKRPYSAEDVVSKRGTLQQVYPSSLMARKLFNLFEERAAKGEPVHTSASVCQSIVGGPKKLTSCLSGCH